MFKEASIENELISNMENNIVNSQNTDENLNKIAKVIDYLHAASSVFENINPEISDEIINIISNITNEIK